MTRLVSVCAVAVALMAGGAPQARATTAPDRVILVVIDGLDPTYITAQTAPRLSALLAGQGARTFSWQAARSIMMSETNPNHTAMLTGAYGATSGITGNQVWTGTWVDANDPSLLRVPTLFETIESEEPSLVTALVMGKSKLAQLLGGDADIEYDPDREPFWRKYLTGGATDQAVMDFELRTLDSSDPDFTFVNLPGVDSLGHLFGASSWQYPWAISQADRQIGRLVDRLQATGKWDSTVLMIASDHGMETTPGKFSLGIWDLLQSLFLPGVYGFRISQQGGMDLLALAYGDPTTRAEQLANMRAAALRSYAVAEALYRLPNPADGGSAFTVDTVHPAWRVGDPRVGDLLHVARLGTSFSEPINPLHGNHGQPITRHTLAMVTGGWTDIVSGTVPDGVPESDPRHVVDDTELQPGQSENVDWAPTIAALLGISAPSGNQGRILDEAFDPDP